MSGWIPWNGGTCPVDGDTIVEVNLRSDEIAVDRARNFCWTLENGSSDIIAYRLQTPQPETQPAQQPNTDDPAEIWIAPICEKEFTVCRNYRFWNDGNTCGNCVCGKAPTKYIRADLVAQEDTQP
jgi:hypothetical protein